MSENLVPDEQQSWRLLSSASWVCVSWQKGETDPLSSLELAHSQESVTWVGQPESARQDCLAVYLLPIATSYLRQLAVGVLLTWRQSALVSTWLWSFLESMPKHAVPGLKAQVQSKVPHCLFVQLVSFCWAGSPAESCQAYQTLVQQSPTKDTDLTANTS